MKKYIAVSLFIMMISCTVSCSKADVTKEEYDSLQNTYDALLQEQTKDKQNIEELTSNLNKSESEIKSIQDSFDSLNSEYAKLQSSYEKVLDDYDKLNKEHNKLIDETADWVALTDEQKAAELARAEADRIKAEEEAKIEKEKQEKAEEKARLEREKKEAEEKSKREAEEKKGYDTGIKYNDLARYPDDFEGKKVKFKGEVVQVTEINNEVQIRLATKKNSWGGYSDDIVYVYFDKSLVSGRILEDDVITVYGVSKNLYSYTSVLGATITIPLICADKIDTK